MERLEEFDCLCGFKLFKAYESNVECSDGTKTYATVLQFANDKHVAVDVVFIDGEYTITEPYAITDDFEPVDKQ